MSTGKNTDNQLFIYTWRAYYIENSCVHTPTTYSAIAQTKEQAIAYILERLVCCEKYEKTVFDYNFPREEREQMEKNAHIVVPDTLMIHGSYCDQFFLGLNRYSEDSDEGMRDETLLRNFLLQKEPEKQPICQGFVVLTSHLDG